ncbi:dTDP-6-deoxy-L-talose 4-dehydrogenase (NAD(+)) [Psilocybe cubensis]|uniref:dTDP-6-deoxy-L-talose 4-dehydrogenase (NAD(+)) n=2 Tax=Psilocybe cubensis TaxID=181762 RepID=A0ACB8H1K6_PSICU|nr:dTDP-6-deoxy-L-talose 4-dehydrogenase (NAD(+)) [Psilocybe cubensis]KAH9481567.1 dTDP-6-deoxy-L-talose 4-dehydrogenase (NAD(+)) [Psilocybe cubensis]
MKIVVTGCNGRVGQRVVKASLERGHSVLGVDVIDQSLEHQEAHWIKKDPTMFSFKKADLRNYDTVLKLLAGYDAVIHLAAFPNPDDYIVKAHNSNVVISWNMLRACAELGIDKVAQASSVNVIGMAYCQKSRLHYFPIDELHPCETDEPYGLSKIICEMQADVITRRYESMRVASLRLHWSVPSKSKANVVDGREKDLWGYVQEDSAANAFMLAIAESDKWTGHERFFIAAPTTAVDVETLSLLEKYWPQVPIKEGVSLTGTQGLFDCSKAAKLLGWHHAD